MQTEYGILVALEAFLILSPFVEGLMERLGVPALVGYSLLGLNMIPHAEIALVIVYQCRQLGGEVVPDSIFVAIIVISIMTAIFAPLMLRMPLVRQAASHH